MALNLADLWRKVKECVGLATRKESGMDKLIDLDELRDEWANVSDSDVLIYVPSRIVIRRHGYAGNNYSVDLYKAMLEGGSGDILYGWVLVASGEIESVIAANWTPDTYEWDWVNWGEIEDDEEEWLEILRDAQKEVTW